MYDDDDYQAPHHDNHHGCVTNSAGIIGVTGREQEDLKRCQEAILLTWLLLSSDDHDQIMIFDCKYYHDLDLSLLIMDIYEGLEAILLTWLLLSSDDHDDFLSLIASIIMTWIYHY